MKEELFETISALRSDIHTSFPNVVWPQNQRMTYGETEEEMQVRSDFEGKVWWDVPLEVLRVNYGSMAFFTPSAYHYFLPSYLSASLDNFDPDDEILMFTVFSLAPTKTDRNDEQYSKRISQFSVEQRETIRSFLKLVVDAQFYSLLNDAERGLKKFWKV